MSKASIRARCLFCAKFAIAATIMMAAKASAQDAEPRSYTNTPIGLNFLIAGYLYSQGKMAFDPQLAIADAQFHSHTEVAAYVRSFNFFGQSAKFRALEAGPPREHARKKPSTELTRRGHLKADPDDEVLLVVRKFLHG